MLTLSLSVPYELFLKIHRSHHHCGCGYFYVWSFPVVPLDAIVAHYSRNSTIENSIQV